MYELDDLWSSVQEYEPSDSEYALDPLEVETWYDLEADSSSVSIEYALESSGFGDNPSGPEPYKVPTAGPSISDCGGYSAPGGSSMPMYGE
ncbi:hypothetical protein [Candidatus Nanohalococcus occultus]|uniref:Uncharacterized protein n=1 Tax=Candidatus Nanohalococcus occultus TaxID=2978047 RepID=A0ABY8CFV7_9ARCH|nr:hypothetical protein SVXNc_0319 [Candidatus Nanohaloarchaeota archaeon SVXNc]